MAESQRSTTRRLLPAGCALLEPEGPSEVRMADALAEFSDFLLGSESRRQWCRQTIERDGDRTAGALAGGSDLHAVYRVDLPAMSGDVDDGDGDDDGDDDSNTSSNNSVAAVWLRAFHQHCHNGGDRHRRGRGRLARVLTYGKLRRYMLSMCDRFAAQQQQQDERKLDNYKYKYSRLSNCLWIVSLGPYPDPQVRHVDGIHPNVAVFTFCSPHCPTTILYDLEGPPITNALQLLQHWEQHCDDSDCDDSDDCDCDSSRVPALLRAVLAEHADRPLGEHRPTRGLAAATAWGTLDRHLAAFGKLYQQPVVATGTTVAARADGPGTTLVAARDPVHAGPAAAAPRLVAFAVGVPDDCCDDGDGDAPQIFLDDDDDNDSDKDGELQYNPVTLHLDLCCIVFAILDAEHQNTATTDADRRAAKLFLLRRLLPLLREYPHETHERFLTDDRAALRDWLRQLVSAIPPRRDSAEGTTSINNNQRTNGAAVEGLLQEAVNSDAIIAFPGKKGRNKSRRGRRQPKKLLRRAKR